MRDPVTGAERHLTIHGGAPHARPNPPPRPRRRICGGCGTDHDVTDRGGPPEKRWRCRRCFRAEIARGLPEGAEVRDPFARMED